MSTPGGHRPSWLHRLTRPGRHRVTLAAATVAALTVALVAPATATAAPQANPGPVAGQAGPPSKARSARPLCDTVVAKDQARCFALVMETNGVVPNLDTPSGYGPTDIQSAYKLPANGGAGMTIASVVAYDAPTAAADLAVYRSTYGLPPLANGQFRKVDQRGGTDYPAPNEGWAGEAALDVDAITAVAPNANILLVVADSNSFEDLGAAVNQAVAQGAKFVSNSYGTGYSSTPGSGEDDSLLPYESQYYNHPGVVVTASTGDDDYGVSFPAASTYVTAVGGTSLTRDAGSSRGWSESVWHNSYGGPGSGCSIVFAKPAFQTDSGCAKRTEADVSAVADPETGLAVYYTYAGGSWSQYGGTSLSAPLVAAIYALGGNPVAGSYPNSYPYTNTGALNDVTTGLNGSCTPTYLCTARAGYDGPTGLGTPNGTAAFSAGPRGEVTGKVTDAATGVGIAGASVTVGTGEAAASAVTDANGGYTVSIPPGDYPVSVSAYGYKTKSAGNVTVTDGGEVTLNVKLTAVPSRSVTGTVTDGSGHNYPLYARIDVQGAPGGPIYTDPYTGYYSVDLPQGSTFTLTVTAMYPGYLPGTSTFKVGGADITRNFKLKVDPDATAVAGYTISASGKTETFDAATAPAGWTVTNAADVPGWVFTDGKPRGNLTGGTGGFAIVDSDLSGNGHHQDTYLTSPTFDLSAATDPLLEFDTDYNGFSNSTATVEVSGDGSTWKPVWTQTTADANGHVKIHLGDAAKSATTQVRFHYTGTYAWWWELDNVFVGTKKFVPVRGGLVAGVVTDANTGSGVNGAKVTADADSSVTATTSPTSDPAIGDGFYWMFSPLTGSQSLTASKGAYGPVSKTASVGANTTTHVDFSLPAGRVGVDAASLSATVKWGASATRTLTLTNSGGLPATVKIGEQTGGFVLQRASSTPTQTVKATVSMLSAKATAEKAGTTAAASGAEAASSPQPNAEWQIVANYPQTIQDNRAVVIDGAVYSVGGYTGSADSNALYRYDADAQAWNPLSPATDAREAGSAGAIGGKLVYTGGWGPGGSPDGKTELYDPSGDAWSTGAANPKPHAGAGTAVLGGKLYAVGGCSASACGSTDVQVYDATADSWSSAAAYPESQAWQSCGGIGDKLYCAGGTTDAGSTAHGYVYDPGSDSWSPIADLPLDAWGSYYTAANGQLLVAGGVVNDGAAITNQGFAYDPTADAWTALPNLARALYRGAGALGFFAVGGNPGGAFVPPVNTVQVLPGYDQGGNTDVSWLSEDPTELTLAPGASAPVTVTLNGGDPAITQPGTYSAAVTVSSNTPYPSVSVPVELTVKPPAGWGKLAGTVSTAAGPLAGATVEIDSWSSSYTLTTGKDGTYALWLDTRNNPLTLIVAKDGYKPQTETVKLIKGSTVTKNWTLVKK